MELSVVSPSWQLRVHLHGSYSSFPIPWKKNTFKCYCGEQVRRTTIQRICDKLRREGYVDEAQESKLKLGAGSAGEIFLTNAKHLLNKYDSVGYSLRAKAREGLPPLAEMALPADVVKRLTTLGLGIANINTLKIGKAGISEGIIHSIHERWKNSEVIRIKCQDLSRSHMRNTHHLLEIRTGGIVVWRAGSIIILYRGTNYEPSYVKAARSLGISLKPLGDMNHAVDRCSLNTTAGRVDATLAVDASNKDNLTDLKNSNDPTASFVSSDAAFYEKDYMLSPCKAEYEREMDSLLDGLGPRFTDWWGYDPLPIDADLLPAVCPGYKKPFRVLPSGMKPKLTDNEMTRLRRLGRPLPPHFALGINEHLQGLAVAMAKLWERSEIAKIAVKRDIQNADGEKIAEELKWLTGGSLISRDREFIVFYRGKDFLPSSVAAVLEERKAMAKVLQEKDGVTQLKSISPIPSQGETTPVDSDIVSQFAEAREQWMHNEERRKIKEKVSRAKQIAAARRLDSKLKIDTVKEDEVEKKIVDIEKALNPTEMSADKETITEEERFMLCKLGLRMKPFLILGRRGVFDGVVENMHLHWKYRDLVKIISKEKSVSQVNDTARMLEYESGGILVAVERVSKGHAIIVYRGKNYRRPTVLRPKSLLTKNAALKRSIDIQRCESLNLHTLRLERNIERMKSHLGEHDATYFDHCDSDNEKEDSLSITQTGKTAADLEKTKPGTVEHMHINNKMNENVYRAEPLSNKQRLILRRQALKMEKRAQFHVGKSNVLSGLAKSIRSYFEKHALVIVGVKGRARGTSIQEIAFHLEEATGGVLVSQEPAKLILYRGWPEGEENPSYHKEREESQDMSPELMSAIWKECGL